MSEHLEKLRGTLEELESELETVESLDDSTRVRLEEVSREIRQALDRQAPAEIDSGSLSERLEESLEEFEATHPSLTQFVIRMIDGLGQMGI